MSDAVQRQADEDAARCILKAIELGYARGFNDGIERVAKELEEGCGLLGSQYAAHVRTLIEGGKK